MHICLASGSLRKVDPVYTHLPMRHYKPAVLVASAAGMVVPASTLWEASADTSARDSRVSSWALLDRSRELACSLAPAESSFSTRATMCLP